MTSESRESRSAAPAPASASVEPVQISCPGCGRNDYVRWPVGQPIYHWKCFNCSKEFDLTREGGH